MRRIDKSDFSALYYLSFSQKLMFWESLIFHTILRSIYVRP